MQINYITKQGQSGKVAIQLKHGTRLIMLLIFGGHTITKVIVAN